MNYYFKIKIGFSPNGYIHINSLNDLEKAQFAFITGQRVLFDNGEACRGQDIMRIEEDWHKEMGWNSSYRDENGDVKGYELGDDDWADIKSKGIDKKYLGIKAASKMKVEYLLETKRPDLIGKGVEVEVPEKPKELNETTKTLAAKLSLNR